MHVEIETFTFDELAEEIQQKIIEKCRFLIKYSYLESGDLFSVLLVGLAGLDMYEEE